MRFDTTPLEYLDMSDLAYADNDWEDQPVHQALLARGWQPCIPFGKTSFLRKGLGGYRGVVYVHNERKEIVCAHRGTASFAALDADVSAVVQHRVHAQVTAAIEVCLDKNVRDLLAQGYSLTFTGHSLGGFLATTSLYFCQRTDLTSNNGESFYFPKSKAVVFDPAGSQGFIDTMEPHGTRHAGLGDNGIKNLNILHFVSLPNYVNAYAPHVGGTIYTLFPQGLTLDTVNPVTYLKETHSLEKLRTCFLPLPLNNNDDPRAGYPKIDQCKKMSDWPLIDVNDLASLSTVFGALSAPLKLGMDSLQGLAHLAGYRPQRIAYIERLGGGESYRQALALAIAAAKQEKGQITVSTTLSSHYHSLNTSYDIALHSLHFGTAIENFLKEYRQYLHGTPSAALFFREKALTETDVAFFNNYNINAQGEVIQTATTTSIFASRTQVARFLIEKNLTGTCVMDWIKTKIGEVIANNNIQDITSIKLRLAQLEQNKGSDLFDRPIIAKFTGIANETGAHSELHNITTQEQFTQAINLHKEEVMMHGGTSSSFFGCSIATKPNSKSVVINDFTR